jgi:hypothetical protein
MPKNDGLRLTSAPRSLNLMRDYRGPEAARRARQEIEQQRRPKRHQAYADNGVDRQGVDAFGVHVTDTVDLLWRNPAVEDSRVHQRTGDLDWPAGARVPVVSPSHRAVGA